MQRLVLHPHLKHGRSLVQAQSLRYLQRLDSLGVRHEFFRNLDIRRGLKVLLEAKCVANFGGERICVGGGGDGAEEGAPSLKWALYLFRVAAERKVERGRDTHESSTTAGIFEEETRHGEVPCA